MCINLIKTNSMYYRITKVSHRAGVRQQMIDYLKTKEDLMASIEGLHHVRLIGVSDTEVIAVSEYDNAEQVANAEEKFGQIMVGLKDYFAGPPEVMHGDAFWSYEE